MGSRAISLVKCQLFAIALKIANHENIQIAIFKTKDLKQKNKQTNKKD